MSPFKRPGSPYYYTAPTVRIPGRGRVRLPQRSTGARDMDVAKAVERTLKELGPMGYGDLVAEVEAGALEPVELHQAKLLGRLDVIRHRTGDPPLARVIQEVLEVEDRRHVRYGIGHVQEDAPDDARVSWLVDPRNVTWLLARGRNHHGRSASTLRTFTIQGVARILDHAVGRPERLGIMAQVKRPAVPKGRDVALAPDQVDRLLEAAREVDPELERVVRLFLTTGMDVSPLLRLEVRHVDVAQRRVLVPDRKTETRFRSIPVGAAALQLLQEAMEGKRPTERIVSYKDRNALSYRWNRAREAAELPRLRMKDLRHVFAAAYLQGGGTLEELRLILGHSSPRTTMVYLYQRELRGGHASMDRAAATLGLSPETDAGD